jgi:hypothetical protein
LSQLAFATVRNDWAAAHPRNRDLLNAVEMQLGKLRLGR